MLLIGRIIKPHGLRGKVEVYLYNRENSVFKKGVSIIVSPTTNPISIQSTLPIKSTCITPAGKIIASFEGINKIEQAEKLKGFYIFVKRENLKFKEGEILVADLIGMTVYEGKKLVGKIENTYDGGAGIVLVISNEKYNVDFPFQDDYIEFIDEKNRRVFVKYFSDFEEFRYNKK